MEFKFTTHHVSWILGIWYPTQWQVSGYIIKTFTLALLVWKFLSYRSSESTPKQTVQLSRWISHGVWCLCVIMFLRISRGKEIFECYHEIIIPSHFAIRLMLRGAVMKQGRNRLYWKVWNLLQLRHTKASQVWSIRACRNAELNNNV